jgi:hypothetical protein
MLIIVPVIIAVIFAILIIILKTAEYVADRKRIQRGEQPLVMVKNKSA